MEKFDKENIIDYFKIIIGLVAFLWIVLIISTIMPSLKGYGIIPRELTGLPGIIFSPFLHGGFGHLLTNSIGLIILGTIFLFTERKLSFFILIQIIILGGFGTWLIGRSNSSHIGASGVIYGMLGYLISLGIFTKSIKTIIISVIVFFLYGGAIWGIIPGRSTVSWEGHLCGLLAGVFIAWLYSKRDKVPE